MILTDVQRTQLLANPSWVDIGNLPSNFEPYEYKKLHIRPFQVGHLRLISKALSSNDISFQIQAVDQVIDQDVHTLSTGDYFYVRMWLKIHSSTKTPLTVDWHCGASVLKHKNNNTYILNSPKDRELLATVDLDDYDEVPCKTHNTELVYSTDLEVVQLPEEGYVPLPEGFDFPRVGIYSDIKEGLLNPELKYIVGAAQWLAGGTLAERIAKLESEENLDTFNTALALSAVYAHGVKETTTLHCNGCGMEHPYLVQISDLSFFQ